jgi:TolB protein
MDRDPDRGNGKETNQYSRLKVWAFRAFLMIVLVAIGTFGWQSVKLQRSAPEDELNPTLVALGTQLASAPTQTSTATQASPEHTLTPVPVIDVEQGAIFYAARENGYSSLWMVTEGGREPIRLTNGTWNDCDPAISPQGDRLVFTSDRNGFWDLFVLDLMQGTTRQLTDTPGYEGHPTWSPDGIWVAFESYEQGDFDIWILPVSLDQAPIRLTNHPAKDTDPDWDPQGRRIAFVSDRDGSADIFIAALDKPDDRFLNLTQSKDTLEHDPAFSPDGSQILYSSDSFGVPQVMVQTLEPEVQPAAERGNGQNAVWSPDGQLIISVLESPQRSQLNPFSAAPDVIVQNGLPIIRNVKALAWTGADISLNQDLVSTASTQTAPLYQVQVSSKVESLNRVGLSNLPNVNAPNASLSDAVDEAFNALRMRIFAELGWDFLSNLDYAFTGLNDPLPPGLEYDDWLFTGRAFAFSQSTVQAGWVELVREEFEGQTYWRVFVRASRQDGSLGAPLRERPWNFDARFQGSGQAYDQGGELKSYIPSGYYVDFTELACDYGFERLPSLPNWRTYYHGARFHEFVYREGLDWREAMLELYPAEALITPTPFRTPTPTPTRTLRPTPTPWWLRWVTPTPIPTNTPIPTATIGP